ncbi:hypothetical protein KC338_g3897 [Hortaea werneckii]|nr:hypothetical protein KC338_g3897 [Hortaea werneckii]
MPSLTPIRVRGKRTAAKDEKWNAGKKRKASRLNTSSHWAAADDASYPSTRKRKRRTRTLAFVEELPTEILQTIFYFSGNLNLALASTSLQSQLSSKHVYLAHTTRLLHPLLGNRGTEVEEDTDIAAACRLLSSQLLRFKPNLDTEILRKAVIDNVFDPDVVLKLADYAVQRQQESMSSQTDISINEMPAVDFLDPALWAWAEKTRKNGDDNGEWLSELLKDKSRQVQPQTRSVQQPADDDANM